MSEISQQQMTACQLAALPDEGVRYELVAGELRMMSPAGSRHGRIAARFLVRLGNFVEEHDLGETYAAETGFLLTRDPDTVRAPDVAYVSAQRLEGFEDEVGFLPLAPDLAAEVVSPSDSYSGIEEKALAWLEAGCRCVLVIDPETRTVREYRSRDCIRVLGTDDVLDVGDILPGWRLQIGRFFA